MTDQDERRRFTRVPFDTNVELTQGDIHCTGHLLDISLRGALAEVSAVPLFVAHQAVELKVPLEDGTAIVMTAELAHQINKNLGLKCTHIDIDSISHLRRLVELNMGDPAACDRELAELIN